MRLCATQLARQCTIDDNGRDRLWQASPYKSSRLAGVRAAGLVRRQVGGKHFLIFIHQTTTHCRQDCLCRDRALQRREFAV